MTGRGGINKYFTWHELLRSQTAARRNIDNIPGEEEKINLRRLANEVLLPLRKACRAPLVVTSGYRSPALCDAIGSRKTSRHTQGLAADVECFKMTTARLALLAAQLQLPLAKIILECHEPGDPASGWVHLGMWRTGENRMDGTRCYTYSAGGRYVRRQLSEMRAIAENRRASI